MGDQKAKQVCPEGNCFQLRLSDGYCFPSSKAHSPSLTGMEPWEEVSGRTLHYTYFCKASVLQTRGLGNSRSWWKGAHFMWLWSAFLALQEGTDLNQMLWLRTFNMCEYLYFPCDMQVCSSLLCVSVWVRVYMCACVWSACVCICVCECAWEPVLSGWCPLTSLSLLIFSKARSLTTYNKSQRPAWFSLQHWRHGNGLRGTELGSSPLHSRCVTHWAISSAPEVFPKC